MKQQYDKIDRAIIAALREDSTQCLLAYSAKTHIPKSTLHDRLQKLFRNGVRCTPLINWEKIGYPLTVCFFVPYDEHILSHPAINTAQHVSPNLLYLECLFASMKEIELFKKELHAARYFTVVEVLKREGFIPPAL